MELFVVVKCGIRDSIEHHLHRKDDGVGQLQQALNAASLVFESWVLSCRGVMQVNSPGLQSARIEAEYLSDLPKIVSQMRNGTSDRVYAGVATASDKAMRACQVSQKRGGRDIVLYTPGIERELKEEPEEDNGVDVLSTLNKGEGDRAAGEATQVQQGQLSATHAMPSAHNQPSPSKAHLPRRAAQAQPQAQAPGQDQPQGQPQDPQQSNAEPSTQEVLQSIGQVLQEFQVQIPVYEQMQQSNPQAYQAVMEMMQGMVMLARKLKESEQTAAPSPAPVQKSELELEKAAYQPDAELRDLYHKAVSLHHPDLAADANDRIARTRTTQAINDMYARGDKQGLSGLVASNRYQKLADSPVPPPRSDFAGVQYTRQGGILKMKKAAKVEVEPHEEPIGNPKELRKLFDDAAGSAGIDAMSLAEKSPNEALYQEWVIGYGMESKEHPHISPADAAKVAYQHLQEDPKYYTKTSALEGSGLLGKEEHGKTDLKLPPGSVHGGRIKVTEPVTGKAAWHSVRAGQHLSSDGHAISARLTECPKADTPESRAAAQGAG